jgi:enamine deaminase RidA (YjgF/YER057c/UK114 family)
MSVYEMVNPGWKWKPTYTFSPATRVGNLLFISGTTATDENGKIVGENDIKAQTRYIYQKFEAILNAVGASCDNIVQTVEFITTTEGYRETAEVRREVFRRGFPAATGVIVKGLLNRGALIEIQAIAVLDSAS